MWRIVAGAGVCLVMATVAAAQPSVTFSRDVAPILSARCTPCHADGGDAPFSLMTFEEAHRRAATIRAVITSGYMPPWKPAPGAGEFHGERRLTAEELALLTRWIDSDRARGDERAVPLAHHPGGWAQGEPDAVLTLPAFTLRSAGPDVFRNFVVPLPVDARRFVRGWQFRSGTPAVHHANIRLDPTRASRQLDDADPAAGYEGVILRSADFPEGHFLGWTPGQTLARLDDAAAWAVEPNTDMVVQLHLRPTGKPEMIAPTIGLYFGNAAPSVLPVMIRLGRQQLLIPPGTRHTVTDTFVLPVPIEAHAVQAHAHYRARAMHTWATLPDGSRRELLRIDDWDPAWQERYQYRVPVSLPAGAAIHLEYIFDNTTANARNPQLPPQPAEWGWRSHDEMGDVWLQVTAVSARDRDALAGAARRKMLAEDAIGSEVLIAREPDRVDLRNDAATIYMSLDQPSNALRHFAAAARLQPSASASFNVGVALEATGDRATAAERYRDAVTRDANHSAAHNNYGSLLMREGRATEAHAAFTRAVSANPGNAEAHANLALTSIALRQPDAAEAHVMAAIRLRPDRSPQYVQFVWLLASAADETERRPAAACRIAEAIVTATSRNDAAALDARAMACR
jgi:tetratricopeptide (TPR) repeat protein